MAEEPLLIENACAAWANNAEVQATNLQEVRKISELKPNNKREEIMRTQTKLTRIATAGIMRKIDAATPKMKKDYSRLDWLRLAAAYPKSKQWMINSADKSLHLDISNRNFSLRMAYHCGKAVMPANEPCWRLGCSQKIDTYDDHMLKCHHSISDNNHPMSSRHNRIVKILAKWIRAGGFAVKEEHVNPELQQRERTDIHIFEGSNLFAVVELTVISIPPASNNTRNASLANLRKTKKYCEWLNSTKAVQYNAVIAATGEWVIDECFEFMESIIQRVAARQG